MSGLPTRSDDIGTAGANPAQYSLLGWLKSIFGVLSSIGSDTTPVPVTANLKSGNYAYSSLGSPSVTANTANQVIYSNPFVPSGETIGISGAYYATGTRNISGTDGYMWLECDLSGGTNYKAVPGSKIMFSDIPNMSTLRLFSALFKCKGGNCRIAIFVGTITGSDGNSGWNMFVLN